MTITTFRIGALTLLMSISVYAAQAQADSHILQVPEKLPEQELLTWKKTLPTDGWFILHFNDRGDRLFNYSNKDYEMNLWLKCSEGNGKPGYLIEYSDKYGDGDYGGIDFISSNNDNGNRVQFELDGKNFGNPFANGNPQWEAFTVALKKAQKLTLSVFNKELNPETAKDEERLNRAIEFKLAHGELLDKPVSCGG